MAYGFLADLVAMLHAAYVGFVVLGQLAIVLGWIFARSWIRNFWFRVTHLAAIVFVALEAGIGMDCPLTIWENQLRLLAGQEAGSETFMGRIFRHILFLPLPSTYFTWMHISFALLVVGTFLLCPPRWPNWLRPGGAKSAAR